MIARTLTMAVVAAGLAGCAKEPAPVVAKPVDVKAIEAEAHGGYVAAINSNDVNKLVEVLTRDIVYQPPHEPEIVGRDAVRKWAFAYMSAYRTKWEKRPIAFTVDGDWAFERYAYTATDTDRKTGAVSFDRGKGINIFHHDPDGRWRVAVDGWSSDLPVGK